VNDLNIKKYHQNIDSNLNIREESELIGDNIYFYPDGHGNIITLTKQYKSIIPKDISDTPWSDEKKDVDFVSTFFLGSMAFVGLFILFQLSRK